MTQQRRPILLFQEDHSPGKHDMLVAACNPSRYALLDVKGWHASCEENLLTCLRALGHMVEAPQPINLFTNIPLTPQGELDWQPALTAPGDLRRLPRRDGRDHLCLQLSPGHRRHQR